MLEPSIDSLQEKINSKYTLVTISARSARELQDESKPLIEEPKSKTYRRNCFRRNRLKASCILKKTNFHFR